MLSILEKFKPLKKASAVLSVFLLMVGLVAALLPPRAIAQEKIDLTLKLVSGYYNEVTVGKDNIFFLEIRNTGNTAVTNIRLSSVKPEDWVIDFKPEQVAYLGAGSSQTIEINVKPTQDTDRRGHQITFIAEANQIRKVMSIWLTVRAPQGSWLWIGGLILLGVVAGFIIVFIRLNRRPA